MGWGEPLLPARIPDIAGARWPWPPPATTQGQDAEVERLRSLVCALEEECAARAADGRRLAQAIHGLLDEAEDEGRPDVVAAPAARAALFAHYNPAGPLPLRLPDGLADGRSGT